jgi:hypothetical protein
MKLGRDEYRSFLEKACQEYIEVYNLIIKKYES